MVSDEERKIGAVFIRLLPCGCIIRVITGEEEYNYKDVLNCGEHLDQTGGHVYEDVRYLTGKTISPLEASILKMKKLNG